MSLLTVFDFTPKIQWAYAPQNQLGKARRGIPIPSWSEGRAVPKQLVPQPAGVPALLCPWLQDVSPIP